MPQGAPPGELLFKILSILFSEKEASRIALLPLRPFTASATAVYRIRYGLDLENRRI